MTKTEFIMAYNIGHRDGKAGDYCPNEYDDMQMIDAEPCEDAISREAFEQVCKERDIAIEQLHELGYEWGQKIEPCDDVISRHAALSMQYRIDDSATLSTRDVVNVDDIEDLPPVKPQEKTGRWIIHGEPPINVIECSECGQKYHNHYCQPLAHFCSMCGCRMVESQEGSE